jgi:hypothetical protein
MTIIKGKFADITNGGISLELDAPIFDISTSPDTLHLANVKKLYPIINGELPIISGIVRGIDVPQSATFNVTYRVGLYNNVSSIVYYFLDGRLYDGLVHQHTDGFYYTGSIHSVDAVRIDVVQKSEQVEFDSFNTIVPNVAEVEFRELLPSNVSTDKLPYTIQHLAEIIINTPLYLSALSDKKWRGEYNISLLYSKNDEVKYAGSSWIYINELATIGQVPSLANSTYWDQTVSKGDAGGTGGQDTAYSAGWNGSTWAPTANAVYDIIQTLATAAQLANYAPLINAALQTPTRTTHPSNNDRGLAVPTTKWVGDYFATLDSPIFTGNPSALTQAISDVSGKLATTKFVDDYVKAKSFGQIVYVTQSAALALSSGFTLIPWNTEILDSGNNFATGLYTVPSTGYYRLTVGGLVQSDTASTGIDLSLYINGARKQVMHYLAGVSATFLSLDSTLTYLFNQGDVISLRLAVLIPGTNPRLFIDPANTNYLSIEKQTLI